MLTTFINVYLKMFMILTKLTGLFVSAIAAQIFFTGVKNFLD